LESLCRCSRGTPTVTIGQTTNNPLRDLASFLFTKDAANRQGQGVSYDFTIDDADKGKILTISFEYAIASGTYADNDLNVYIYDVTNDQLIQPGNFQIKNSLLTESFQSTFQTNINSNVYRLILHVASTSSLAYSLKFNSFSVGPISGVIGTTITDWQSYTPSTNGLGTVSLVNFFYRRVGDSLEIHGRLTTGTHTAVSAYIGLPSGISIDFTKVIAAGNQLVGTLFGVGRSSSVGVTTSTSHGSNVLGLIDEATVNLLGTNVGTSNQVITLFAKLPVVGWSSGTIIGSENSERQVSATATNNAGQAIATSATKVSWQVASNDTTGSFNTSLSRFVAPVPGPYSFNGTLNYGAAAGLLTAIIYLYKNGSQIRTSVIAVPSGATFGQPYSFDDTAKAGDYYEIYASTSTASTLSGSSQFYIKKLTGNFQVAATESINARYTGSSTLISASFTTVVWATKVFDSRNANTSSGYVISEAGKYQVNAGLVTNASYGVNQALLFAIFKNGVEHTRRTVVAAAGQSALDATLNDLVSCLQGDIITIRVASQGTSPTISASSTNNFFSIFRSGN
jgi:hypothetical protein